MEPDPAEPPRPRRVLGRVVLSTLVAIAVLEALVWGAFALAGVTAPGIRIAFAVLAVPVGFVFGAVGHAIVTGQSKSA